MSAASGAARGRTVGAVVAVVMVVALSVAMVPLRAHIGVTTAALVLVVPVVTAVAIGGFAAGSVATAVGFLAFDFVFVPPYYTLAVGDGEDYAALAVYAVVMVVMARVVARVETARSDAQARAGELGRLFDVSELLVRDSSVPALLEDIVVAVRSAFELDGAALLLPRDGTLTLVASSGAPLSPDELAQLSSAARVNPVGAGRLRSIVLVASGRPVGLLALRGVPSAPGPGASDTLLRAFANHMALALERAQLQEQAVRATLLEEVDRLRRGLVGAISHDLRTPLSTIKVSASALLDPTAPVPDAEARELLGLIDGQADRLDRLVANLLDMTRIQSGALELRCAPVAVADLVEEARSRLGSPDELDCLTCDLAGDLPPVDVDRVLISQVLANLLDNALRYSPPHLPVVVGAERAGVEVQISVTDSGPGLVAPAGAGLWESIARRPAGGGGGLGLAIVEAFVEVHGGRVWIEAATGGGSRVVFTVPSATVGGA